MGRERDVTRIQGLLRTRTRLVTVIGAAGVGKTRLALEVARENGVLLALELASARSLDDLCRLVAQGLQIELGDEPDAAAAAQRIGAALVARATASEAATPLVVLDEFERLPPSCGEAVAGWAARAESLRFLITSRVALGVVGETVYELLPLRLPAAGESPADSPAVRLFIARALRTRVAFDAGELREVTAIVERLEGVPLAIELAAAMLESQSPGELHARLEQLLDADPAEGEDRRSLRGAIASAWDALAAAERDALVAGCVFRGGFTVEALSAVAEIDNRTAHQQVDRLRTRALLFPLEVAGGMAPRFDVYDSVRRYVAATAVSSRLAAAQQQHRAHYLRRHCSFQTAVEPTPEALSTLEAEQANLLAVLERSLAGEKTTAAASSALSVVVALAPLRIGRAPLAEYLQDLDGAIALAAGEELEPALRVMAWIARGRVHSLAGRLATAALDYERALALAERGSGEEWIGRALIPLAIVRRDLGDTQRAAKLFERASQIGRRTGQPRLEAEAAGGLARVGRDTGAPPEQAIALAQQAVALARRAGDLPSAARMESRLGTLLVDLGRHEEAGERFEAARTLAADLGLSEVDAIVAMNLAVMAHDLGQLGDAEVRYRAAITRTRELGLHRLEAGSLMLLALLLLACDRATEASTCLELALQAFAGGPDAPYAGLTHVALGAALAAQDRTTEAQRSFDAGRVIIERGGDLSVSAAADVLGAHLQLAAWRAALSRQQLAEAQLSRAAANELVARVKPASASILRLALSATAPALARAASTALPLRFARDLSFVDLPSGVRVDLRAQPLTRRILLTLIDARRQSPCRAVARDDLVRAVWPDETLARPTGKNRLHVAMTQLRALGLRAVVLTRDGGYLLDPDVPLIETEP